jgi:hypothetical protein
MFSCLLIEINDKAESEGILSHGRSIDYATAPDDCRVRLIDASSIRPYALSVSTFHESEENTMTQSRCAHAVWTRLSLSILLCLALQACSWGFAGGTGEPNDPYQIATVDHLLSIGSDPSLLGRHYLLTADIDLVGHLFTAAVIAPDMHSAAGFDGPAFTGTFNGLGHRISGLSIDARATGNDFLALFGRIGHAFGGSIRLCYTGGDIIGTGESLGGLVGYFHTGTITESLASGNVSGSDTLGGLVGYADSSIGACCAMGRVAGRRHIGGLVGYGRNSLTQCYATGNVSGDENVGGLVGFTDFSASVAECYATGAVVGDLSVGGLLGFKSDAAAVVNSFWDVKTSGVSTGSYGTPLTTT